MYISKVSLVNYRNFKNAKFEFDEGVNTVIGENGSGKTNLFRAMRLLLEDSSMQYAYKMGESDFNRALGKDGWKGHWIIISIEFDDICDDEAIQALFIHGFGKVEKTSIKKASYNLFFRPKADIRQKLFELPEGDHESLNQLLDSISIRENYEVVFTGKSNVDFNAPDIYRELVGDFDTVKFPETIDASKFGSKIPHQLSVSKEISFTFIKALRDVVSDFSNRKSNPLLGLLKRKSDKVTPSDYQSINDLVSNLNEQIEVLDDVKQIKEDIWETIRSAVGHTYSPSTLSIKSALPNEAEKLLQSLRLYIGEPDEDYEGGIHELSLGGANLIFLTLKLLEFKYQQLNETFANFLIIEEPEAHIHTHIQKTLFDKLDYHDTQIFYSTHSTHISEVCNVKNINILAKKQNYAVVFQPSCGLDETDINHIQRYLDAVRTNLLFAKGVILVEGDAEEIQIPTIVKKVLGVSLDEMGISLINIRSTGFENVAQLFHDDRIMRRCSILTDLDDAICDTTIIEGDSDTVKKYKKSMEQSKQVGAARKVRLDKFAKDNQWIEIYYANNTFEIDFVMCGNELEASKTVNDVYKATNTKKIANEELTSDDISIVGKRIITMAEHMGKGWYSILLSSYINENTIIPEYIMKGIHHAKEEWSISLISSIVRHRLQFLKSEIEVDGTIDYDALFGDLAEFDNGVLSLEKLSESLKDNLKDSTLDCLIEKLL